MDEILVAIDGCKHSEKVVDYATELAKKSPSAKIILVHVTQEVPIPEEYKAFAKMENVNPADYYSEIAKRILNRAGERIRKQSVGCEEIWRVGNPTEFILDTAESRNVSLIVVGVHGLHRLGRIRALGSTSRRIIENSTVPVVAVP